MDLQRVVCRKGHIKPPREKEREGVAVVVKEEGVVRERGHGQPNLGQVEEVLQPGRLAQVVAVCYFVSKEEGGGQVVDVTRLTSMRSEVKCVVALGFTEAVKHRQICPHVVGVVSVRRVVIGVPFTGRLHVFGGPSLWAALIIHHVEPHHLLEKHVQLRVRTRVACHLKQRNEDVVQHILEIIHGALRFVYGVEARQLDEPDVLL
mmetsp:Transcript_30605/g.42377  ORF Transcript_30605/g.42377 Transcript_30605/m.42377 type:complete len:205 (+) Transcript_30605:355-969(+)